MQSKMPTYLYHLILISVSMCVLFTMSGCYVGHYLEDGQSLYTGMRLDIAKDSLSNSFSKDHAAQIKNKMTPKPNAKLLGMYPELWLYFNTKEPKPNKKGLRYFFKYKLGKPPILMKDVDLDHNQQMIVNFAENKGYFHATVGYDTLTKHRKTTVIYELNPKQQWRYGSVAVLSDSTDLLDHIEKSMKKSLLHPNEPFDLAKIDDERTRIDSYLKNRGYYFYNKKNIIAQLDTTSRPYFVDLRLKLKKTAPTAARDKFSVQNVIVYPNYGFTGSDKQKSPVPAVLDSVRLGKGIYLIDDEHLFRHKLFERTLQFHTGDVYNRKDHDVSLKRLSTLGVFKFVKNQFYQPDSSKNVFDAYYLLTPRPFKSLQVELKANTNSANYAGSEINLNWQHRNFFHGAETFKIEMYGAYNVQIGGAQNTNARTLVQIGAKASLSLPQLLIPFRVRQSSEFTPRTNTSIGYEFQERTGLYALNNANFTFEYNWKKNLKVTHNLALFDFSLVKPQYVTEEYEEQIAENPYLAKTVDEQLIFGPTYTYTFSNNFKPKKNTFYFQGYSDFSGLLYGWITSANVEEGHQEELFNTPFSQYIKLGTDFRHYYRINANSSLASRINLGVAYPYGNSDEIPFSKQFFAGGGNDNRGFRARSLGPGSFDSRSFDSDFLFEQSGDITIQGSVEYRATIYKFFKWAMYLDIGNVWLINENKNLPGGTFSDSFWKELAMSAGLGFRLDFNIFVLRLDMASPIRKPYLPEGERWTFKDFDFSDADWRSENLLFNIAVGYPF